MRTSIWSPSKISKTFFQESDIFALFLYSELNVFHKHCLSLILLIKTSISWVDRDGMLITVLQLWLITFQNHFGKGQAQV